MFEIEFYHDKNGFSDIPQTPRREIMRAKVERDDWKSRKRRKE